VSGTGEFSAYAAIQTESGRIGIVTCLRCGAAVLLDEEKATLKHLSWHLSMQTAPALPDQETKRHE
jgi:hypothetical protein